ncbi:MAG TPA: hypothetical protein DDW81_02125 [Cryomorphaceae bacterium]|nr:hypothetical protein [Cryomorphaceae bacterium]
MNTKAGFLKYVLNPFEYIAGLRALLIGLTGMALSIALGVIFDARFDGVLNLHFTEDSTFYQVVTDQCINYLSLCGVFYLLLSGLGARQTRFIDLAGTLLLAMAPVSILPIFNYNGILYQSSVQMIGQLQTPGSGKDVPAIVFVAGFCMLAVIAWTVALFYQSYKICSNFKGPKLIISFSAGLLLAIVISKYLINLISL